MSELYVCKGYSQDSEDCNQVRFPSDAEAKLCVHVEPHKLGRTCDWDCKRDGDIIAGPCCVPFKSEWRSDTGGRSILILEECSD
jgi:hypothetical protein